MPMFVLRWPIIVTMLLLAACSIPSAQSPSSQVRTPSATALTLPTAPVTPNAASPIATPTPITVAFEGAQSIALAAGEDGVLLAVLGMDKALFVVRSEDQGQSFGPPVKVTGQVPALVSRLERPALATGTGGRVVVGWLEPTGMHGANIWYSLSNDSGRSFQEPILVGNSQAHETTMVRAALADHRPFLSWLQGGALQLAHGEESTHLETQVLDNAVCDCCQPALLVQGEQLLVAYRNVEHTSGGITRDIYVGASADGGATIAKPVRVSDAPWYLNACPISGPAIIGDRQHVYVTWMDGRNDIAKKGQRGDVWLAHSTDGGRSFGPNIRVNPHEAGYHNLPALAIDPSGRLHIAWEAEEEDQASILYSTSDDRGLRFTPPRSVVVQSATDRPSNAALTANADGTITFAWVDRAGAYVMTGI